MRTVPIDISKLAQAVGDRLSILAQDKAITLHMQTPSLPPVSGDGDRLAQVLTNLLSNAIKYTLEGGQVWLTTQASDTGVEIVVRDVTAPTQARPSNDPGAAKPVPGAPAAPGAATPAKPGDVKPGNAKPADAKPADAKPADAKPGDAKPGDAKPAKP